jgi:hypothetical protein
MVSNEMLHFKFNFASEYTIRKVEGNPVALRLDGTYLLPVCVDDVNLLGIR